MPPTNYTEAEEDVMHKATKIKSPVGSQQCWDYRGGYIEHLPRRSGERRNNWYWQVCGARGWVDNKSEAKAAIDRLLRLAQEILDAEKEAAK
jgi:hypothetical protein